MLWPRAVLPQHTCLGLRVCDARAGEHTRNRPLGALAHEPLAHFALLALLVRELLGVLGVLCVPMLAHLLDLAYDGVRAVVCANKHA